MQRREFVQMIGAAMAAAPLTGVVGPSPATAQQGYFRLRLVYDYRGHHYELAAFGRMQATPPFGPDSYRRVAFRWDPSLLEAEVFHSKALQEATDSLCADLLADGFRVITEPPPPLLLNSWCVLVAVHLPPPLVYMTRESGE